MSSRRRIWPCYLSLATVLQSIILFYLAAPHFYASKVWRIDEAPDKIPSTENTNHGADTVPPATSEDLTVHLHPNEHQTRAARTVRLDWNVTKGERRPDGVAKDIYLINNQFPGPLIECRSGDYLVITVSNQLDGLDDLTIHWHGVNTPNDMVRVLSITLL